MGSRGAAWVEVATKKRATAMKYNFILVGFWKD